MANFPGPYELRLKYTTVATGVNRASELRISFDSVAEIEAGTIFPDIDLVTRNASALTLDAWFSDLMDVIVPLFNTTANFSIAEVWKYLDESFAADFVTAKTVGVAGTAAGAGQLDGQAIITFRTTAGGIAKIDLRQSILQEAITDGHPFAVAVAADLADFLTALNTPMIGRDNGYVFVPLNLLVGKNERYTRDRLRP